MMKLAFITGTRAEYGLLRPLIRKAFADPELECSLLVTGAHLRPEYGETVSEIEKDGIPIAERIDILRFGNSRDGVVQASGLALRLFGAWFSANPVDACVVLGDRYEIFASASAAAMLNIPVVHISGGDVTFGAQDDWFRHCLTKMSALHFPYCEAYRQRLLRLGEQPERVFNVGALGSENIRCVPLLEQPALSEKFGFDFAKPYCLVTFHPETMAAESPVSQLAALLAVMEEYPDMGFCITGANADAGGDAINAAWQSFVKKHPRAKLFASMGLQGYLSAMKYCAAVVGNSSSGVVETPEFGVPCVNIGDRQTGRLRTANVIDCRCEADAVRAALHKALTPEFAAAAAQVENPFYQPDTSGNMLRIIKQSHANGLLASPKHFYDGEAVL